MTTVLGRCIAHCQGVGDERAAPFPAEALAQNGDLQRAEPNTSTRGIVLSGFGSWGAIVGRGRRRGRTPRRTPITSLSPPSTLPLTLTPDPWAAMHAHQTSSEHECFNLGPAPSTRCPASPVPIKKPINCARTAGDLDQFRVVLQRQVPLAATPKLRPHSLTSRAQATGADSPQRSACWLHGRRHPPRINVVVGCSARPTSSGGEYLHVWPGLVILCSPIQGLRRCEPGPQPLLFACTG